MCSLFPPKHKGYCKTAQAGKVEGAAESASLHAGDVALADMLDLSEGCEVLRTNIETLKSHICSADGDGIRLANKVNQIPLQS